MVTIGITASPQGLTKVFGQRVFTDSQTGDSHCVEDGHVSSVALLIVAGLAIVLVAHPANLSAVQREAPSKAAGGLGEQSFGARSRDWLQQSAAADPSRSRRTTALDGTVRVKKKGNPTVG